MICNNCKTENEDSLDICHSCGLRLIKTGNEEIICSTALNNVLYAGFWKRAAAVIIDSFLLLLVGTALNSFLVMPSSPEQGLDVSSIIIAILLGWLYFALMESSKKQATIGKTILGIIVTDSHGKRISFYRASGRHFSKIVSSIILNLGYIMAGFTKKKQALHDIMFDCLVIVKQ